MRCLTATLATKLTACLVGSMVLLFGFLGYLNLRLHRQPSRFFSQALAPLQETYCRHYRDYGDTGKEDNLEYE